MTKKKQKWSKQETPLQKRNANPPEGIIYIPEFLHLHEQRPFTKQLETLDYKQDYFRGRQLKREYKQFGYAYVSTGRKLTPAPPMPPFVATIVAKGRAKCPHGAQFNQCIITKYPKGAGIGWHTDAPSFGDCIMAISLGAVAKVKFRVIGSERSCYELEATPGSLYVMQGKTRWNYQHCVAPMKSTRYSLTFRWVGDVE